MTGTETDTGAGGTPSTPSPATTSTSQPSSPRTTGDQPDTKTTSTPDGSTKDTGSAVESPPTEKGFKVPDAYKDKPWAGKIKNEEDLYKQIDNLDTLVGKKAVPPDLKDEKARTEFYNQVRPADTGEFIKDLEFTPDTTDNEKTFYGQLLHKTGAPPEVANAVLKDFQANLEAQKAELTGEKGFKEEMKKSFGDDFEKPAETVANSMKEHLTEDDRKIIEGMPNVYLGAWYRAQNAFLKAYGVSETGTGGNHNPGAMGGGDVDAQISATRAEMRALSAAPHKAEQKAALQAKLDKLYDRKAGK